MCRLRLRGTVRGTSSKLTCRLRRRNIRFTLLTERLEARGESSVVRARTLLTSRCLSPTTVTAVAGVMLVAGSLRRGWLVGGGEKRERVRPIPVSLSLQKVRFSSVFFKNEHVSSRSGSDGVFGMMFVGSKVRCGFVSFSFYLTDETRWPWMIGQVRQVLWT